jgi:hypothetical protein
MRAAIPPFPNTPSWRGAQSKRSKGKALSLPLVYLNDIFPSEIKLDKHYTGTYMFTYFGCKISYEKDITSKISARLQILEIQNF